MRGTKNWARWRNGEGVENENEPDGVVEVTVGGFRCRSKENRRREEGGRVCESREKVRQQLGICRERTRESVLIRVLIQCEKKWNRGKGRFWGTLLWWRWKFHWKILGLGGTKLWRVRSFILGNKSLKESLSETLSLHYEVMKTGCGPK